MKQLHQQCQESNDKHGGNITQVSMIGTTSSYLHVRDLQLQSGRFIAALDHENHSKIAVLGSDTAQTLFGLGIRLENI